MKIEKIKKFFNKKKVLVLGHTGFKGSWLCLALKTFNCKIYGISNSIPTKPSNYILSNVNSFVTNYSFDIRDYKKLERTFKLIKPDIIFHLAAQSLVIKSFENPYDTWTTNALGTLNLLDILKKNTRKKKISTLIITSDKCYKNIDKKQGYKENETLGGYEPYGASKATAEIIFHSYYNSFLKNKKNINIATARAGNVIGGGDWSNNRIIPDLIKSIKKDKILHIRYPDATRPWQHVLDLVFGYITLVYSLSNDKKISGESFNFGPFNQKNYTVISLLKEFKKNLKILNWKIDISKIKYTEANLLNLNVKKTFKLIKWKNLLSFKDTVKYTADWYSMYLSKSENMQKFTLYQIKTFQNKIK